jgi:hypothetical protein
MKLYLTLYVTFLVMINVALGAVGDVGVSDNANILSPEQSISPGTDLWDASSQSSGAQSGYANSYTPYESGLSSSASLSQPSLSTQSLASVQAGYPGNMDTQGNHPAEDTSSQGQGSAYPAPQIRGPMQEQLTAEELGLSLPQMESFSPDGSLGFVSASLPGNTAQMVSTPVQSSVPSSVPSSVQATVPGSSTWYYPSSVVSANRFFVQTASGFRTVGGCSFEGYLPIWADIKSSGNFFVYEWYPGQSTPTVRWWGWTGTGWKKGWFSGDVSGWHILCYNSGIWSNYIYIYVYPRGAALSAPSGYSNTATRMTAASLPSAAPIPPDPGAERLVLPDFNQYRPITEESYQSGNYPAQERSSQLAAYPRQTIYPDLASYPIEKTGYPSSSNAPFVSTPTGLIENPATMNPAIANPSLISYPDQAAYIGTGSLPGKASSSSKTCTTCTSSTVIAGGVSSSYPYEKSCPTCTSPASQGAPYGYALQSYKAVYPVPSICKCNEYYVQSCPGRLATVAGVFCGEWLPLWSKVSRPGVYWSFEWTVCSSGPSYYCTPEVKNFGYKNAGWYQTWFKGNNPGWHILSYHSNDWSNYIYIYVWPAD